MIFARRGVWLTMSLPECGSIRTASRRGNLEQDHHLGDVSCSVAGAEATELSSETVTASPARSIFSLVVSADALGFGLIVAGGWACSSTMSARSSPVTVRSPGPRDVEPKLLDRRVHRGTVWGRV